MKRTTTIAGLGIALALTGCAAPTEEAPPAPPITSVSETTPPEPNIVGGPGEVDPTTVAEVPTTPAFTPNERAWVKAWRAQHTYRYMKSPLTDQDIVDIGQNACSASALGLNDAQVMALFASGTTKGKVLLAALRKYLCP